MSLPPNLDLSKIPLMQPPPGVASNFINPSSVANAIIIVQAVFLTLMLGFVTLRIYTKAFLIRSLGWDDYTCVLAAIGSIIHAALLIDQTHHGYGRHSWDIPLSLLTAADIRNAHMMSIIAWPTSLCTKLSILLLYLHVFHVDTKFRYIIYSFIAAIGFFYLGSIGEGFASLSLCTVEHVQTRPFCTKHYRLVIAQAAFSMVSDFAILGIPITRVWRLQLSFRRKIGVIGVFMTGLVACTASVTNMSYVVRKMNNPDVLYAAGLASIYGCVETNLGIISSAMICLPAFYHKSHLKELSLSTLTSLKSQFFPSRSGSRSGSRSKSKHSFDTGESPCDFPNISASLRIHEEIPQTDFSDILHTFSPSQLENKFV